MEKTLCFRISGVDLFLEQTLVEYNNVPIFFVCNDNRQRYLVLCTDISEYNYVITKITIDKLYAMLSGKCPMRDVFFEQKYFWEIVSAEDIEFDNVMKKDIVQIKEELLPEENSFFSVLDSETAVYLERIRTELYNADVFSKVIQCEKSVTEEVILLKGNGEDGGKSIEQYTNINYRDIRQTITSEYVLDKNVYSEQMKILSAIDIRELSESMVLNSYNYSAAA